MLPLRYGADFRHFAYANADAPKGGGIHVRRALELFDGAGWRIVDGVMRNERTDEPFFVSPFGIRSNTPYMAQLHRSCTGRFDANGMNYDPTHMPGLQRRNRFDSASACVDYGQN